MTSAGTFASSTCAVSLNGATTIANDSDFTVGATGSTGTSTIYIGFAQSGAVTLNGNTALSGDNTVASGKDFHMTDAGTFSWGTGAVTLSCDVAVADGKDWHMAGAGTFAAGSGAVRLHGATTIADDTDFTVGATVSTGTEDQQCRRPIQSGTSLRAPLQ